jgi:hypothetical protein
MELEFSRTDGQNYINFWSFRFGLEGKRVLAWQMEWNLTSRNGFF